MLNALRTRGFLSLMLVAGMSSATWAQSAMYQPDQHIMVRTGSKGERRCVIIAATKRPDGAVEYRVKAIDNGELMTIIDRASSSVARTKPVEAETPKVSVSSDPLLASSLRQTALPTAQSPDYPVPPTDAMASQPRPTSRTEVVNSPNSVLANREPRSLQAGQKNSSSSGFATVGDAPSPLPVAAYPPVMMPTERLASGVADPVPLQQVRYIRETVTTTAADPVSVGFAIPVANSRQIQTPVKRPVEREDRMTSLAETIKNALQPSARLSAVESLSESVGTESDKAKTLLMSTAVNDPAAIVRAACIRGLVKMGVRDIEFRALLASAKQDADARVRIEADQAEEMVR